MAKKKVAKKNVLTKAQKDRIKRAVKDAEKKMMANYKKAVKLSGRDWSKESVKYRRIVKRNVAKASKRIEVEVRKNPAGAAVAAAAIGAVAGAFLMSMMKRRR